MHSVDTSLSDTSPALPVATTGQLVSVGKTLGERYQIEQFARLTHYGELYQARDLADGKMVSVHVLSPNLLTPVAGMDLVTSLQQEVQTAVQLDHKNIATTLGIYGGEVIYLVGEFVAGHTLHEMLQRKSEQGKSFSLK